MGHVRYFLHTLKHIQVVKIIEDNCPEAFEASEKNRYKIILDKFERKIFTKISE